MSPNDIIRGLVLASGRVGAEELALMLGYKLDDAQTSESNGRLELWQHRALLHMQNIETQRDIAERKVSKLQEQLAGLVTG